MNGFKENNQLVDFLLKFLKVSIKRKDIQSLSGGLYDRISVELYLENEDGDKVLIDSDFADRYKEQDDGR